MKRPTVKHLLSFRIGVTGRYGWPICASTRGPVNLGSGRLIEDEEKVTCLRCLDMITRPQRGEAAS